MRDILIDWQKHEFNLDGENVSIELCPLAVGAVFKLMKIKTDDPDDRQIEIMTDIFNRYVRKIEGITINGKPINSEQLANTTQLMGLAADVMTKLTQISQLPKVEEKN